MTREAIRPAVPVEARVSIDPNHRLTRHQILESTNEDQRLSLEDHSRAQGLAYPDVFVYTFSDPINAGSGDRWHEVTALTYAGTSKTCPEAFRMAACLYFVIR